MKKNIKRMNKKVLCLRMLLVLLICLLSGCSLGEWFENTQNVIEEELHGKPFTASVYDFYGNNTMNISGKSVSLDVMDAKSDIFASDTDTKYVSTVLDVTIDGSQVLMVGDTIIFAEDGLDMITDFRLDDINSNGGGTGYQPLDRYVNKYKNFIGKSKVVLISTQAGVPIGMYQGDRVYVEVPNDLPKTTRLSIDGNMLYIHRANYIIMDSDLIK